jgi:hypothetical protein
MPNPAFPTIQSPSYQYELTPDDPGVIFSPQDGPDISWGRKTASKITYRYHWNAMPDADKVTLLNFYQNTVRGSSKICTWGSINGRIITPPRFRKVSATHWAVELDFKEA